MYTWGLSICTADLGSQYLNYRLGVEGGDKVPISKFGLWTSAVVFIGPIKTYLVFWIFWFGAKNPLRRSNLDLAPPRPPQLTEVAQNKCSSLNLGYFDACKFFICCLRIFAIFSKTLWHPGTPGGGRGAPGGPPQRGTAHGYPWVIILIFYVSGIS